VQGIRSGRGDRITGPPLGTAGSVAQLAGATSLVAQYPQAKDVMPTIADDVTPLSAQWTNYLGLLIEAIEAEIGPFPQGMVRFGAPIRNLKDLLGTAVMSGLSASRSAGVNAQGKLFGVQQFHLTKLASLYALVATGSLSSPFAWPKSPAKQPLFFAITEAPASGNQDIIAGPAIVRGNATWTTSTAIGYQYRGHTGAGAGSPTWDPHVDPGRSDQLIRMDALVFYMIPDEDA